MKITEAEERIGPYNRLLFSLFFSLHLALMLAYTTQFDTMQR